MTTQDFIPSDLTELPFGLPGRIYRSPMPFCSRDPNGQLIERYRCEAISVVVVLVPDEEISASAGKNLPAYYQEWGFEMIHLPMQDYGTPAHSDLRKVVSSIVQHAEAGRNIAVHCNAGIGRTGLFMTCLAKDVLGLSSDEAIRWVRNFIPGALETQQQVEVVFSY